jgi:RNA polymerase sigma factor (TIGR02999 family)
MEVDPEPRRTATDFTVLLAGLRHGESEALSRIVVALYAELRVMARGRLRHGEPPTLLDTTSLVHESYLRLLKAGQIEVTDRSHFLAYASRVMRSVVVDFIRERSAQRRGGQDFRVPLEDDLAVPIDAADREILRVHDALDRLAGISERMARVVEMRYFAGMMEEEISKALDVSQRTVRRDWEKARLILAAELKHAGAG